MRLAEAALTLGGAEREIGDVLFCQTNAIGSNILNALIVICIQTWPGVLGMTVLRTFALARKQIFLKN